MPNRLLAFAGALLLASGVMAQSVMAQSVIAQSATVQITDAWARATPGQAENGAAYVTIESPAGDQLTGVASPVAAKAELHAMKMEGGIMTMHPVDALDLPAGQPVALKPGAVHIMLVGLKRPLRQGETVPLILHFAKAGTRQVAAAVGKVGATGPESMPGMRRNAQ